MKGMYWHNVCVMMANEGDRRSRGKSLSGSITKWERMQMVGRRGRQMRCARQAIHGTANRQLSNQELQFELAVLLINLDLEMLHVLDKLEIIA